jgi:hypothetical protein
LPDLQAKPLYREALRSAVTRITFSTFLDVKEWGNAASSTQQLKTDPGADLEHAGHIAVAG